VPGHGVEMNSNLRASMAAFHPKLPLGRSGPRLVAAMVQAAEPIGQLGAPLVPLGQTRRHATIVLLG
jgi:hypothetical protein